MGDTLELCLLGHPPVNEVRDRAVYDLRKAGKKFHGDVDVDVRSAVRNRQCMAPAMECQARVEQVILAALQCGVIESRRSIRRISYSRPVIEGIECLNIRFTVSQDRLLVI